jgi:GTPase Era involved in 16S rRNA processing
MYGHPVRLELWVKVEPKWSRNFWILKRLGYAG